jgi:hypothetical protein
MKIKRLGYCNWSMGNIDHYELRKFRLTETDLLKGLSISGSI